jgi:hypothetical protein
VQVAQILGRRGPVHFQEYVTPSVVDKALIRDKNIYRKLQRRVENLGAKATSQQQADLANMTRGMNKRLGAAPTFNDPTQKVLKEFRKEYPRAYDMGGANIVGGRLVDFEAGPSAVRTAFAKASKKAAPTAVAKAPQQAVAATPVLKNSLGLPMFPKKQAASAWGGPSHKITEAA